MTSFLRDLAFGARILVKRPLFTLLLLLVLVPGIAVNLAVFTFVKAVLLEALPFPDAERLVTVIGTVERETTELRGLSYPDFLDLADQSQSLEALAAAFGSAMNLTGETAAERVEVELVTPGYFDVFGVGARVGRLFTEEENQLPRGAMVAVLSDELWRSRFGADGDVLGQAIRLEGQEVVVIGVAAEGFRGFEDDVDLWVPLTAMSGLYPNRPPAVFESRGTRFFRGIGRLRQGVSPSQAQEEVTTITRRLAEEYPTTNENRGVQLEELDGHVLGELRPTLRMLWVIAALVLVVVVANALNLLLVRLLERRREITLRAALGAGPGRIGRQLLAENLILGLVAGGLGTLLGTLLVRLGARWNPIPLPGYAEPRVDPGVLAFALGLSLLLGVVLGLLPMAQTRRLDLAGVLRDSGGGGVGGGRRSLFEARRLLLIAEVAIAVVVLVGAGLVYRSFENQRTLDPGFDDENLVCLRFDLPADRYTGDGAIAFAGRLGEEAAALPGVSSVGLASGLPMGGGYSAVLVHVEDRLAEDPEHQIRVYLHNVDPGFFETLEIPLIKGEIFRPGGGDEGVLDVVVSRKLAELGWPDADPIGERLRVRQTWLRVVGVAAEVRFRNLVPDPEGSPDDPDLYVPLFEAAPSRMALVARTEVDPETLIAGVRELIQRLEPDAPVHGVDTIEQILARQTRVARITSLLFALLGALVLLFALSGLYAVISYSISQKTTEIGLRKALGATRGKILTWVIAEGLKLVMLGLALGLALALSFQRVLASLLFGVTATDPATYAMVTVFLLLVAVLSCISPAWRASRLDPAVALKVG